MKKWLLLALATLVAAPAFAATYYVRGDIGDNNNAGTSLALAWNTIEKANAAVRPGDLIYVYARGSGSPYTTFPNPDSAGSNPTGNGKITFIGASLLADPLTNATARGQIGVPSMDVSKGYTVVKGLYCNGSLSLAEAADRDSIAYCTFAGNLNVNGADYLVVSHSIFNGARVAIGYGATTGDHCVRDTIDHCTFPLLAAGVTGDATSIVQFGRSVEVKVDSLFYRGNRHTTVMLPTAKDTHPRIMFNTRNSTFYRNYWRLTVNNTASGVYQYAIRMRDSTYRNVIRRDTILADGRGRASFLLATSGSSTYAGQKTTFENTVDSCFWNAAACGSSYVSWSDGMFNWTLTWNVIVMRDDALRILFARGKNFLRNNTIVSAGGVAGNFRSDGANGFGGTDSTLILRANVFASYEAPLVNDNLPDEATAGSDNAVLRWSSSDFDSGLATTQYKAQSRAVSNNNLYTYYGYRTTVGDRSMLTYRGGGWKRSMPGDSSATIYSHLENTYRMDSTSVYGSPQFGYGGADSTMGLAFNPVIGVRSAARGIGLGGQDAGAIAYPGVPAVRVSPSYIAFSSGIFTTSTFDIINDGTATLTVSSITSSRPTGISVSPASASIAAGATQTVTVTYASGTSGALITILSNDPVYPTISFPVVVSTSDTIEP